MDSALIQTFAATLVDLLFLAQQECLLTQPISRVLCCLAAAHAPLLLPFVSALASLSLTAGIVFTSYAPGFVVHVDVDHQSAIWSTISRPSREPGWLHH